MDHPRPSLRLPPDVGGKLLDDALAKRKDDEKGQAGQSYREHVTAVYDAWCGLKDVHAGLIARVADRYGLTAERVLRSSLLCVALHDVGKLSRNFLAMMEAPDEVAYKEAVRRNYRHEVAALWLVDMAAQAWARATARSSRGEAGWRPSPSPDTTSTWPMVTSSTTNGSSSP